MQKVWYIFKTMNEWVRNLARAKRIKIKKGQMEETLVVYLHEAVYSTR